MPKHWTMKPWNEKSWQEKLWMQEVWIRYLISIIVTLIYLAVAGLIFSKFGNYITDLKDWQAWLSSFIFIGLGLYLLFLPFPPKDY